MRLGTPEQSGDARGRRRELREHGSLTLAAQLLVMSKHVMTHGMSVITHHRPTWGGASARGGRVGARWAVGLCVSADDKEPAAPSTPRATRASVLSDTHPLERSRGTRLDAGYLTPCWHAAAVEEVSLGSFLLLVETEEDALQEVQHGLHRATHGLPTSSEIWQSQESRQIDGWTEREAWDVIVFV